MRYGVYDASGNLLRYEYIRLEDEPTVQGSLWNRANVLPDSLVALLGLPQNDPQLRHALLARPRPIKIASYEVAGSYQWTAPDLIDGKPYKIGVLIIGGGGSGGCGYRGSGSTTRYTNGGAAGFTAHLALRVNPGDVKSLVVGVGGSPVTTTVSVSGNNGGSSAFDEVVVDGGEGGYSNSSAAGGNSGSRGSYRGYRGYYGLESIKDNVGSNSDLGTIFARFNTPEQCFNRFECVEILGSGGGVRGLEGEHYTEARPGGKNPLTGKGGGNGGGVTGDADTAIGEDASEPGCGGGAAAGGASRRSGAGADGAVYIYFLGVSDE